MSKSTNELSFPAVYEEYKKINKEITYAIFMNDDYKTDILTEECPVCFEDMDTSNSIITDCNHRFCMACTLGTIFGSIINTPNTNPACPMCRSEMHLNHVHPLCIKGSSTTKDFNTK